jgi:hypothetical protein
VAAPARLPCGPLVKVGQALRTLSFLAAMEPHRPAAPGVHWGGEGRSGSEGWLMSLCPRHFSAAIATFKVATKRSALA